jgi:hypothetical protein
VNSKTRSYSLIQNTPFEIPRAHVERSLAELGDEDIGVEAFGVFEINARKASEHLEGIRETLHLRW